MRDLWYVGRLRFTGSVLAGSRRITKTMLLFSSLFLLLSSLAASCQNSQSDSFPMTATAERREFTIRVHSNGVLEAQRSHVLKPPMIRRMENGRLRIDYQQEIAELVPEGTFVRKGDVVVYFSPETYEKALAEAEQELETAQAELSITDAQQNEQREQLKATRETSAAEAASARLQLSRMPFVAELDRKMTQLRIERADVQVEKARNKLKNLVDVHKEELNAKQLAVKQAQRRIEDARKCLAQMQVKAPVDGYLLHETNWFSGEKITTGDKIYVHQDLVKIPDMSQMQVKLQLSETMAQKVAPNQRALINVPSIGDSVLQGSVLRKDRVAKPVKRRSKVKQVEVILNVENQVDGLVPGLSAQCDIIIQEQPDVIVAPLDCVFDRDSSRIVFIRHGSSYTATPVTIGLRGLNFAVIHSGVSPGDELALTAPPDALVQEVK